MTKHYVVSDGEIVLFLWPAPEGGYMITSPMDDRLISQAETLEEALAMGHDALDLLREHEGARLGESAAGRQAVAENRSGTEGRN